MKEPVAQVKPIPPAHPCKGCGVELEPLRRYGGLCADCVKPKARPEPPQASPASRVRVLETIYRVRRVGKRAVRTKYVRVECACGRKSTVEATAWKRARPRMCKACYRREASDRGIDATRYGLYAK